MPRPVCVIVGVGPGTGAAIARRFAADHTIALLARTTETSERLARELPDARALACDATDAASVATTIAAIERDQGPIAVVAYNAGSGTWGTVETVTPAALEAAFRINTLGLLHVAQAVIPGMTARGAGAIVVTGATASRRGAARAAGFAPAKAAQRSLAESMARHLGPKGIHVSLIVVDGVIELARTRAAMPDKPDSFFIRPDDLAATVHHLATQPRSAWSFEVEARPFGDGVNELWTATQVRNHRYPITQLEMLDGGAYRAIPRVEYNYFVDEVGSARSRTRCASPTATGSSSRTADRARRRRRAPAASQFPACM